MQSLVIILSWIEVAALVVGTAMAVAARSSGDAAGRALGAGYLVAGVAALLIFCVLPAMLLASKGYALWLAATLAGLAALPAFVLAVGSVIGVAEYVWKKLRQR